MMPRKYDMNGTTSDETEIFPLDNKIRLKNDPPPAAQPRKKSLLQGMKEIYFEYCSNTSLHGVQYLGQRRPWIEIIFWIFVFVVSIYYCSITINSIYQKWQDTPVIVSFSERSTPVSSIPFPAITICPESKRGVPIEGPQFGELLTKLETGQDFPPNMSSVEIKQFLTMMHVCNPDQLDYDMPFNEFTHEPLDYIEILNAMSFSLSSLIPRCRWSGTMAPCDDLFTTTYTGEGVCFTFNGFNGTDLYRENTVQYQLMGLQNRDFSTTSRLNRTLNWSLEDGYPQHIPLKTYPARVVTASSRSAFSAVFWIDKKKLDYGCSGATQGFKIVLHTPDDVPLTSKQFVRVSLDKEVSIAVKPIMVTTSEGIANYKPEKRKCYLAGEQKLKFFKVYSEKNCELECLTHYTLKRCGCVKFSMPRTPDMPVCGTDKIKCYSNAEDHMLIDNFGDGDDDNDGCNCMPSCTSLEYDAEISQADFDVKRMAHAQNMENEVFDSSSISRLVVYFKDNEFITSKRSELYGLSDFISNCGGVCGLFMGFSLLSVVEMLYHLTLRLLTNMTRKREGSR